MGDDIPVTSEELEQYPGMDYISPPRTITEEIEIPGWLDRFIRYSATTAERERCAKIADQFADDPHADNSSCATGEAIASIIRSGK